MQQKHTGTKATQSPPYSIRHIPTSAALKTKVKCTRQTAKNMSISGNNCMSVTD